jgi:hypothetical protein
MEPSVQRYTFRLHWRGQTDDCRGRILQIDGKYKLEVGMRSPEHEAILLEVVGQTDEEALWPLFWRLCEYRGIVPVQYRVAAPTLGPWNPVPGRPEDFKEPDPNDKRLNRRE